MRPSSAALWQIRKDVRDYMGRRLSQLAAPAAPTEAHNRDSLDREPAELILQLDDEAADRECGDPEPAADLPFRVAL